MVNKMYKSKFKFINKKLKMKPINPCNLFFNLLQGNTTTERIEQQTYYKTLRCSLQSRKTKDVYNYGILCWWSSRFTQRSKR